MMIRARGVDAHDELVGGTLDIMELDTGALELFFQLGAQLNVFVEQLGIVAIRVPARLPRFVVARRNPYGCVFCPCYLVFLFVPKLLRRSSG